MHILPIMQYRPWTASQHRALASFLRVCIIMLFCCAGPWFVLPPCCFIQFLWASSGASTFVLSVSPQRAMSFDAYLMLCIFSVSIMRLSSLFRYGKSCVHPRRNLSSTKWSVKIYTHYAYNAYYVVYANYANTYCSPCVSRILKSSSSFEGNRLRYRWYHERSMTAIFTILGDRSDVLPRGFAELYSSTSSVSRPSRRKGNRSRTWRISMALTRDGGLLLCLKWRNKPAR